MKSKIISLALALVLVFSLSSAIVQETYALSLWWEAKASLPQEMVHAGSVAVLGKIHTISKANAHSPSLHYEYNPATNSWTLKPTPPLSDRYGMASAVYNDKIYLFGGVAHGGPLSNVAIYNPVTDSWSTGTNMPVASSHSTATVVNDKIYIVGGTSPVFGDTGGSNVLQIYDPTTDSWSTGANMPTKRQGAMAAEVNDKIYVIGGRSGATRYDVVEVYDPATDAWNSVTPVPGAVDTGIAAVMNNRIFVMGQPYLGSTVYIYDPATDSWSTGPNWPTPRNGFSDSSDAVLNNAIYVVGGESSVGYSTVVEALCTTTTECVATATSTGMACFTTDNGIIEDLEALLPIPPIPAGIMFPHGMFSFKVTGLELGQEVIITVELPDPVPLGTKWWKYQSGSWYPLDIGDDDGDNIITVTLTDGVSPGDADNIAGQITDPGGPGKLGPVGWETYPINKMRVLLPWIASIAAITVAVSLLVLRRRGRGPQYTRG